MSRVLVLFYCVLSLAVSGCGSGGIAVNYVEGTVTLDSAPLVGATVSFSPVEGGTGKAAVGTTDEKGMFKLTATENTTVGGGTTPGEYLVAITKPAVGPTVDPDAWKTDPNYGKDNKDSHSKPTEIKSEVPIVYSVAATSGLKATVKPGSNTGIKFELTKSFKPAK